MIDDWRKTLELLGKALGAILVSVGYQLVTEVCVAHPASSPTASQIRMAPRALLENSSVVRQLSIIGGAAAVEEPTCDENKQVPGRFHDGGRTIIPRNAASVVYALRLSLRAPGVDHFFQSAGNSCSFSDTFEFPQRTSRGPMRRAPRAKLRIADEESRLQFSHR